jgi:hypothetical protein
MTADTTIQSHQTAGFKANLKQAVSAGIFAGFVLPSRSPVTRAVSQADFSPPSLHPKIPFPAAEFRRPTPFGSPGILGVLRTKSDVSRQVQLSRNQSEAFELLAPFCGSITKSLDSNTAW